MTRQVFAASREELPKILSWIHKNIERSACPLELQMKLEVAFEEAIVNIISYAYGQEEGKIELIFEHVPHKKIELKLKDEGMPFNPKKGYDSIKDLSIEERKIGGLGIPFMMKIMDEIDYQRIDKVNQLTMIKFLS